MARQNFKGVLRGLKVVEFAHVLSGPMAGTLLADMGADVIHVESPTVGDSSRQIGPDKNGVHLWWKVMARNKRAITLDLRQAEGQEVAHELTEWADVVITNMRPDTLKKWRLNWDSLHAINPKLVYLQVTGDGLGTSNENSPGFGKVGEARSGVVSLTGFPDGPPVHTGFSHADTVTGLMGAFAVAAACYKRNEPEFDGELIDIALFEPLFRLIDWQVIVYDQLGMLPKRAGNQLAVAPGLVVNTYPTADGEWITVTSGTPKSVKNVLTLLGLNEADYMGPDAKADARADLDRHLKNWIAGRNTEEALAKMHEIEVVAERIFDIERIMKSDLYRERKAIISVHDDELGSVRMSGVIPKFHKNPGEVWRTGPKHGQDNDDVFCKTLGMSADRFETLRSAGVI